MMKDLNGKKNTMSLVKIESEQSEEFAMKFGVHQASVSSSLLFAIVGIVVIESKQRFIMKILYADNLVLMNGTVGEIEGEFWEMEGGILKQEFEGKP